MGDKSLPLLPVPVEDMTRDSLRVFIPKLIAQAEGHDKVRMGVTAKPVWWPDGVQWTNLRQDTSDIGGKNKLKSTEVLRNVVRSCYQYYDSEELLQRHHALTAPDSPIKVLNMMDGTVSFIPQKFVNGISLSQLEATVPVNSELSATPVPTHVFQKSRLTPAQRSRGKKVQSIEIFICYFCEKDFTKKSDLHDHQSWCIMRPPELKDLPRTRQLKLVPVGDLPRADKRPFIEGLGLLPLSKARVMKKHQNRNREIEITKLDDNDTDSQTTLKSPTTPKTPRSLMSQLSRDLSPPALKSRRKSLAAAFADEEEEGDGGRFVEKEGGVSGEETTPTGDHHKEETREGKEDKDLIKKTSLLTIDLCSSLGQRVKKLMNEQAKALMTSLMEEEQQPYEEFCHTPKKTGMLAKLRNRSVDFPVTFRKSRKTLPKYAHQFKFKSGQRREWYMTSLTGLNARSRELKELVQKCSVSITRLSKKEIEKWASRRKTNYYVNISRLSDLHQPAAGLYSTSATHVMLENLLTHQPRYSAPNGQNKPVVYPQLTMGQRAAILNGSGSSVSLTLNNGTGNNVIDLTPPSTPESAKSPRPIQLLAKSPEQAKMLQQLLQRPLQNRLPSYQSPVKNTAPVINNNNTTKKTLVSRGKKRILEEDDVICLSSDDESESPGSRPPPSKYQKTEASRKANPTLLFKCHLCHTELTCYGSFSNYIEKHFSEKHSVNNIQLVEHLDSKGQKVVSIVEKAIKKLLTPAQQSKAAPKKVESNTTALKQAKTSPVSPTPKPTSGCPGPKTVKNDSTASKLKTSQSSSSGGSVKSSAAAKKNSVQVASNSVGRRRSNRGNGTSEVICID